MKYYLVLELVVICFHSFIIVMCFDNSIVIILTGRDRSRCSRVKVRFLVRISGTLIEFQCFFSNEQTLSIETMAKLTFSITHFAASLIHILMFRTLNY